MLIRIGHSPDPDDAFMFYALNAGKVKIPGIEVEAQRNGDAILRAIKAGDFVVRFARARAGY